MTTWKNTKLFEKLKQQAKKDEEAEEILSIVTLQMPRIEQLLLAGGTSPKDFTLHEAGHSYRVAQEVANLTPSGTWRKLSCYDVALLLFSAYLHDIGMTPPFGKLNGYYSYLLTGEAGQLSEKEIFEFKIWLSSFRDDLTLPLGAGEKLSQETLALALIATSHFARHKHVDWTDEWIADNLRSIRLSHYVHFVDDLRLLCRSHHLGLSELQQKRFEPKMAGQKRKVVHLRYIASLLRVADILDFDPERTPDIVFKHRDIDPGSVVYWHRDHFVRHAFDNGRLILSAEPTTAKMHRAIELMAEEIENELHIVRRLKEETPFAIAPFQSSPLGYEWGVLADVGRDIRPHNDAYEYIAGGFRPNTEKLLQLLSGVALYGHPVIAVRELLQNSFDAVKEHIAYEQLLRPAEAARNPESWSTHHHVELTLEARGTELWLICTDSGVGMSKAIIRDYLLVSGNSRRPDLIALEERCKAAGLQLNRTGEFGIGVLSYFMISDLIEIGTRRSSFTQDADLSGWSFTTEGVGDFGELRRDNTITNGAKVSLRLRSNIFKNIDEAADALQSFIERTLYHAPCDFDFRVLANNRRGLHYGTGWVHTPEELFEHGTWKTLDVFVPSRIRSLEKQPFIPDRLKEEKAIAIEAAQHLAREVNRSIRWHTKEGFLPGKIGQFRIHVPVFQLPGGDSFAFLKVVSSEGDSELKKINDFDAYLPSGQIISSWLGFTVQTRAHWSFSSAIVEVNWSSSEAGRISVSRNEYVLSKTGLAAYEWLVKQTKEYFLQVGSDLASSIYATLGVRQKLISSDSHVQPFWLMTTYTGEGKRLRRWTSVPFPAVLSEQVAPYTGRPKSVVGAGKDKYELLELVRLSSGQPFSEQELSPWGRNFPPQRMLVYNQRELAAVWDDGWLGGASALPHGVATNYPPGWTQLAGSRLRHVCDQVPLWNAANPIGQIADADETEQLMRRFQGTMDPGELAARAGRDPAVGIAWLSAFLGGRSFNTIFEATRERYPDFLREIWASSLGDSSGELKIYFYEQTLSNHFLLTVDAQSLSYKEGYDILPLIRALGMPDDSWRIQESD